jgi:predicted transcriptional regulator
MKIKPLRIVFESLNEFMERAERKLQKAVKAQKPQKPQKRPQDELRFASVAAYQQVMSDQKYAILAAIYRHCPQSIYQLAKILGRTTQNVIRDCRVLEGHGFIRFEEVGDRRKTKVPRLAFNYNAIVICMPSVTYKVEFEDDAA